MLFESQPIYLDNNATTPLDPRALQAMLGDLAGPPANPSSVHWFGRQAREHLVRARAQIASFFHILPEELLFTSGGTESVNLFLRGLPKKGHLITTAIEHSCIYKTVQLLHNQGFKVSYLSVDLRGAPCPEECLAQIQDDTVAIALSAANGETGVKLDIAAFAAIAHRHHIPLLIDAVAYVGKESFSLLPGITAVALSGHKFHAPKGIGALILRSPQHIVPLMTGGNQEFQRRAGTENLAGIFGLTEALRILSEEQETITEKLLALRNRLEGGLKREIPDLIVHGESPRIANTANLAFPGVEGETFLIHLDRAGVAVSHGSACASGALEPSRILLQMGVPRSIARSSLRFSVSRMNTEEEIDRALDIVTRLYKKLRA